MHGVLSLSLHIIIIIFYTHYYHVLVVNSPARSCCIVPHDRKYAKHQYPSLSLHHSTIIIPHYLCASTISLFCSIFLITHYTANASLSREAHTHYYHVKEFKYVQVSWPQVRGEGMRSLHIKDHA